MPPSASEVVTVPETSGSSSTLASPTTSRALRRASSREASPSQCWSTQLVDRSAERKASLRATNRWKGSVVCTPPISVSSSARRRRSIAASRSTVDHHLRDQVVVVRRHALPCLDVVSTLMPGPDGIDQPGHARPAWARTHALDPPRRCGPRSHGSTARKRVPGREDLRAQRMTRGNVGGLLAHDVDPRHELGDAVLHLQARVDLQEAEVPLRIMEELAVAALRSEAISPSRTASSWR